MPAAEPPAADTGGADFTATVVPVLQAHCAPCHFAGGRMHGRLPFDDAETVRANGEGILRRLDGDPADAVRAFLVAAPTVAATPHLPPGG